MKVDTTEKTFELCEEFAYTLKRFGLLDGTIRYWWACELHVLLTEGQDAAKRWRKEFWAQ